MGFYEASPEDSTNSTGGNLRSLKFWYTLIHGAARGLLVWSINTNVNLFIQREILFSLNFLVPEGGKVCNSSQTGTFKIEITARNQQTSVNICGWIASHYLNLSVGFYFSSIFPTRHGSIIF